MKRRYDGVGLSASILIIDILKFNFKLNEFVSIELSGNFARRLWQYCKNTLDLFDFTRDGVFALSYIHYRIVPLYLIERDGSMVSNRKELFQGI